MNKKHLKIGMKVWHKGYEWEVLHYNEDNLVRLSRLQKVNCEYQKIYCIAKIDEVEEIDESQTSISPTMFNTDNLIEECYKDYFVYKLFNKIFGNKKESIKFETLLFIGFILMFIVFWLI